MDMKENEDRMGRTLDALEHPERFTREELEELLADRECVAACRDLLDCREALARRQPAAGSGCAGRPGGRRWQWRLRWPC